jgi:uncharacterized phage protein (TIGR02218 family)
VRSDSFDVSGLAGFADDWFTKGQLLFQSVANLGRRLDIKRHRSFAASARIDFWQAPKYPIAPGEVIKLTPGCDKQLLTCRDKFANTMNFRGFPNMPGNDFIVAVAAQSDPNNNGLKR